jgi:hypothetical protein
MLFSNTVIEIKILLIDQILIIPCATLYITMDLITYIISISAVKSSYVISHVDVLLRSVISDCLCLRHQGLM